MYGADVAERNAFRAAGAHAGWTPEAAGAAPGAAGWEPWPPGVTGCFRIDQVGTTEQVRVEPAGVALFFLTGGVPACRRFALVGDECWIEDWWEDGTPGAVAGRCRLPLAAGLSAQVDASGHGVRLSRKEWGERQGGLHLDGWEASVESASVSPGFGRRQATSCVVLRTGVRQPPGGGPLQLADGGCSQMADGGRLQMADGGCSQTAGDGCSQTAGDGCSQMAGAALRRLQATGARR